MAERNYSNWSRREFLGGMALTGAAAMLGWRPRALLAAKLPPPETTRLRLMKWRTACWVPQYVAEPLLREEGFTDIQYVDVGEKMFAPGNRDKLDLNMTFAAVEIAYRGKVENPAKIISGLHPGCYVLVGNKDIQSVRDLKGKTVWAGLNKGGGPHVFLSAIISYVGLDPKKDINMVWISKDEAMEEFRKGKIAAFISFPPEPQALLEQNIGHRLIDTNVDKPWSQYFCCMIVGSDHFIEKNPVATKRALRAILRAYDIVAGDPEGAVEEILKRKIRKEGERKYILQALKDIPYDTWREFNPEETIRFFALRMHDVGMLKTPPDEFIKKHCDWTFVNDLKQELAMNW
jgi:NitT/TauT family transport system substrate-binding protein